MVSRLSLSFAGVILLAGLSSAQEIRPFRIPIRHADPWMIKALLEGMPVRSPEMSTQPGFQGVGQAANTAASLLKSGRLVVNPTDNSLWFYPDRRQN